MRALGRLVGLAYPEVTKLARLWAAPSRGSEASRVRGTGVGSSLEPAPLTASLPRRRKPVSWAAAAGRIRLSTSGTVAVPRAMPEADRATRPLEETERLQKEGSNAQYHSQQGVGRPPGGLSLAPRRLATEMEYPLPIEWMRPQGWGSSNKCPC